MPGYEVDRLTYEVHANNLGTAVDHANEPIRFYTNTAITDHFVPTYTVAVDGEPVVTRTEVLNLIYQNTYKLIKALKENELLRTNISEEDIMELLREE